MLGGQITKRWLGLLAKEGVAWILNRPTVRLAINKHTFCFWQSLCHWPALTVQESSTHPLSFPEYSVLFLGSSMGHIRVRGEREMDTLREQR